MVNQIFAHGLRALLGKPLIEIVAAHAVRVPFHLHCQRGIREQDAGDFRELLSGAWFQRVAACVEKHVRHVHDQSPDGVVRLQNAAQLLQELLAQIGLLGFRLRGCQPRSFGVRLGGGLLLGG